MVLGQPEQWLALLIESLLLAGQGEHRAVERPAVACVRRGAGDERHDRRPAVRVDRRCRLAPRARARGGHQRPLLLGAVLAADARYPLEAPEDLRDLVWMPAHLQFENGGESVALIPTRYPGSETAADGMIALARKTLWAEAGAGRAPRPRAAHPRHRRRRRAAAGSPHHLAHRQRRGDDGARRRSWLSSSRPRNGCSRRCSIASPTTSRTRSTSRARQRLLSRSRLRQAVLRDLAWLFNATRLEADTDLTRAPPGAQVGRQFRAAGAVGQDRLLARRDRPRARDPAGHPRLRAAHPARYAADPDAPRGRRRSITTT